MDLKNWIRDVPDYPQPGILFRDLTPLLADPKAFQFAVDSISEMYTGKNIDTVAAIDARGFWFGAPVALSLKTALVPLRKPGKLPPQTVGVDYDLEYGSARLEARSDAFEPGMNVLVVDDLLATGGTAAAAGRLIEQLGATVEAFAFVVELSFLNGRDALEPHAVSALIQY